LKKAALILFSNPFLGFPTQAQVEEWLAFAPGSFLFKDFARLTIPFRGLKKPCFLKCFPVFLKRTLAGSCGTGNGKNQDNDEGSQGFGILLSNIRTPVMNSNCSILPINQLPVANSAYNPFLRRHDYL
jgi:hypothetical protein